MNRFPSLLAIWASLSLPSVGSEPLKVTSRIAPGPCFVGQAVEIQVEVLENPGSVGFDPPRLAAEVHPLAIDPEKPASGRFLVIPRRSGVLEIPGIKARSGERSGLSRPIRLTVLPVPSDERPPAFLGGVGAFEVKADAEPATVRAGQELEFRIKLTGPAAWGSERSPDLSGWQALGAGFRVEPLPATLEGVEPPVRTFRYRLRARGAGRVVLPPVAIAGFDPRTKRFLTRATSGVPILVQATPRLDPSSLNYEPILPTDDARPRLLTLGLGLGIAALATAGVVILARRRRPRPVAPARLALKLAEKLRGRSETDAAAAIVGALTTFLEAVSQRPPAALTPPEASQAFGRLTNDPDLASAAERLMIACDRACYGETAGEVSELSGEGWKFFERVAAVMSRRVLEGEDRGRQSRPGEGV